PEARVRREPHEVVETGERRRIADQRVMREREPQHVDDRKERDDGEHEGRGREECRGPLAETLEPARHGRIMMRSASRCAAASAAPGDLSPVATALNSLCSTCESCA